MIKDWKKFEEMKVRVLLFFLSGVSLLNQSPSQTTLHGYERQSKSLLNCNLAETRHNVPSYRLELEIGIVA